jgi:hypothetical protein
LKVFILVTRHRERDQRHHNPARFIPASIVPTMEVHHAVNADSKRADRPYQGQGTGIIEMDRSSEAGRKDRQPFAAEADLGQMDTDSSPSADDSDAEVLCSSCFAFFEQFQY